MIKMLKMNMQFQEKQSVLGLHPKKHNRNFNEPDLHNKFKAIGCMIKKRKKLKKILDCTPFAATIFIIFQVQYI